MMSNEMFSFESLNPGVQALTLIGLVQSLASTLPKNPHDHLAIVRTNFADIGLRVLTFKEYDTVMTVVNNDCYEAIVANENVELQIANFFAKAKLHISNLRTAINMNDAVLIEQTLNELEDIVDKHSSDAN